MEYPIGTIRKMNPFEHTSVRYVLEVENIPNISPKENKTLVALGVNPSKADTNNDDPTIHILLNSCRDNGYSHLIMLNVYPERTPKPSQLPSTKNAEEIKKNMQAITKISKNFPQADFYIGFGNCIQERDYLKKIAIEIMSLFNPSKYKFIAFTVAGNPCHPLGAIKCLRLPYTHWKYRTYTLKSLSDFTEEEIQKFKQNYTEPL